MNEILEGMKAEARRTILLSKDAKAIDRANDVLRLIEALEESEKNTQFYFHIVWPNHDPIADRPKEIEKLAQILKGQP